MRRWRNHGRTGTAAVLAGFLVSVVLGCTACDVGGENAPTRPSTGTSERATDEPSAAADRTRSRDTEPTETTPPPTSTRAVPTRTTTPAKTTRPTTTNAEAPEPTRTTTPPKTTTRPPTSTAVVAPEPTRTTTPPATTPTPTPAESASAVAAASSQKIGWFGWLLLIALLAALIIGGWLVYRSQHRSAWDTEARALESETRTVTETRLPPVLSTTTTSRRGLAWPPVRAALVDLVTRWNALTERASGEGRRNWALRISGLLQELTAAVDAENEALAVGRDPMLLRPRVNQVEQALAAALAVQPQPEPPAAGEPGPPAFQT
jgi:hypothetical protein